MDVSMFVIMIASWITKRFPSLAQYTEFVLPALMTAITVMGIFTNMLPEPDHRFPVPDVKELEKELEGGGGMIIKMAKFTRSIVIGVNWFLGTIMYKWFYNFTNNIARFLPKMKKFAPAKKA